MPGQKQSKETRTNNQIQTKKKPAAPKGPVEAQPNLNEGPDPLLTSGTEPSIQMQADQLSDPRFQREGQQRLARHVGKIGGNQHLQRVIVQMRRAQAAPPEKEPASDLELEQPASNNPVQRAPGDTPGYDPTVSIDPPLRTAVLNQEVGFDVQVTNKRQAPRGTKFSWGWGTLDTDKVEEGVKPRSGPRATLQGKVKKVADTRVDGLVVALGPEAAAVARTDPAGIAVEKPTGKWSFEHRDTAGGASPKIDRAGVGDFIIARLEVNNVTTPETLKPKITLPDKGLFPIHEGAWKGNIYEISMLATAPARLNSKISLHLPGYDKPFEAPVDTSIEMNKQEFLNFCGEANTKIDNAYKAARKWMIGLAIAYGNAYKKHTETLSGQAAKYRLLEGLVLGAALAFVPGGMSGVIGATMKKKQYGDFMIDGVKDLNKWGWRVAPTLPPSNSDGLQAFPTDPLQWRNHVEENVEGESLAVGKTLEGWQHKTNQNDPNFYRDFNPVEKVDEALKIADTKLEELPEVDHKATADDFERGMWTAWLKEFGYIAYTESHMIYGDQMKLMRNVHKDVEERCEELGIDIEAYAADAKQKAEKEIGAYYEARSEKWRKIFSTITGRQTQ